MVRHIICFKLCEGESAEKAKAVLMSMKGKVSCIQEIEVGIDELHSARSYDVFLSVVMADMDALDAYQKDPYHVEVVKKYMKKVAIDSAVIDYTF